MLESWNDPATRHAMLVHWPIVLAFVGLALAVAAAIVRSSAALRWATLACFAGASIGSAMASNAGEAAEHRVKGSSPALTAVEAKALHEHEELGENGWIWALIPAALAAGAFVGRPKIGRTSAWLAAGAGAGVVVWAALTAQAGGELVYKHGLGTPKRVGPYMNEPVVPEDKEVNH